MPHDCIFFLPGGYGYELSCKAQAVGVFMEGCGVCVGHAGPGLRWDCNTLAADPELIYCDHPAPLSTITFRPSREVRKDCN